MRPLPSGGDEKEGGAKAQPTSLPDLPPPEPPLVKLVSDLIPLTIHEGDDATFRCEVSPPDADVTWLRNGAVVTPGPGLEMAQNGSSRTLTVRGCQLKDAGTVTAQAGGTATSARLHVRGLILMGMQWSCPLSLFPQPGPSQPCPCAQGQTGEMEQGASF